MGKGVSRLYSHILNCYFCIGGFGAGLSWQSFFVFPPLSLFFSCERVGLEFFLFLV